MRPASTTQDINLLSSLSLLPGGMVRLMVAGGVRRARLGARDHGLRALLKEFSSACAAVTFSPPLSAAQAALLADLSSDRPPGYG